MKTEDQLLDAHYDIVTDLAKLWPADEVELPRGHRLMGKGAVQALIRLHNNEDTSPELRVLARLMLTQFDAEHEEEPPKPKKKAMAPFIEKSPTIFRPGFCNIPGWWMEKLPDGFEPPQLSALMTVIACSQIVFGANKKKMSGHKAVAYSLRARQLAGWCGCSEAELKALLAQATERKIVRNHKFYNPDKVSVSVPMAFIKCSPPFPQIPLPLPGTLPALRKHLREHRYVSKAR